MKIFPIVAAMVFGVAGVANAQGYDSDKRDPMTEQQRRDSSQQLAEACSELLRTRGLR